MEIKRQPFDEEIENSLAAGCDDPARQIERQSLGRLRYLSSFDSVSFTNHLRSTARYSLNLAESLGLDQREKENIWYAASVHDIGKAGISQEILHRSGGLEPSEFEIVRGHTILGHDILSGVDGEIYQTAADVALSHHERWDGEGYPNGIKGEKISLAARIISIADVYDCITAGRPYRVAQTHLEARKELERCAGTQFEPELVSIFLGKVLAE